MPFFLVIQVVRSTGNNTSSIEQMKISSANYCVVGMWKPWSQSCVLKAIYGLKAMVSNPWCQSCGLKITVSKSWSHSLGLIVVVSKAQELERISNAKRFGFRVSTHSNGKTNVGPTFPLFFLFVGLCPEKQNAIPNFTWIEPRPHTLNSQPLFNVKNSHWSHPLIDLSHVGNYMSLLCVGFQK